MKKTLYHGSDHIIEKPVFGMGKSYNDYGLGFYCTESSDMAKEWAVGKDRDGYANCYQMDYTGLSILDLNAPEFCILHWLTILLENRTFTISGGLAYEARAYLLDRFSFDYASVDVILGYRADDSYFSFAQDFVNGTISYRQLSNAMRLGKLGQQIVLKSPAAFAHVEFVSAERAESSLWFPRKMIRDKMARRDYFDVEKNRRHRGDIYITQIIDEEMRPGDPRLR